MARPGHRCCAQITALQQRLSKDESTINRLQALLGGVTRSRDGSALRPAATTTPSWAARTR